MEDEGLLLEPLGAASFTAINFNTEREHEKSYYVNKGINENCEMREMEENYACL